MPVDLFAALSAMIRAEAARADESASRLRAVGPGGSGPDGKPVAAAASTASSGSAEPERAERPGREDRR
ncbi:MULTISPECIES: hypothetical protein [unclassified Streptomyces]|uniref:hypothetical protein n=1 Tax=unclassified Streptomyces TaxID=2593676 RepID=UPI002E283227|nr:hypothetical protein [Streptomyces sp. NBC_01429]